MARTAYKYLAMAILPLAILLYKPVIPMLVLALGERTLIETVPIDPRDFLRGDYVTLDYRISSLPFGIAAPDMAARASELYYEVPRGGTTAYVSLEKNKNGVSEATGLSLQRPSSGSYIKGTMSYIPRMPASSDRIRIDYGINVYYVKEGTGRAYEEGIREGSVIADVRIWRGIPVLKGLIIER